MLAPHVSQDAQSNVPGKDLSEVPASPTPDVPASSNEPFKRTSLTTSEVSTSVGSLPPVNNVIDPPVRRRMSLGNALPFVAPVNNDPSKRRRMSLSNAMQFESVNSDSTSKRRPSFSLGGLTSLMPSSPDSRADPKSKRAGSKSITSVIDGFSLPSDFSLDEVLHAHHDEIMRKQSDPKLKEINSAPFWSTLPESPLPGEVPEEVDVVPTSQDVHPTKSPNLTRSDSSLSSVGPVDGAILPTVSESPSTRFGAAVSCPAEIQSSRNSKRRTASCQSLDSTDMNMMKLLSTVAATAEVDPSARAEHFQIRAAVAPERHIQLLRSTDLQDLDDHDESPLWLSFADRVLEYFPETIRLKVLSCFSLAQNDSMLKALAILTVAFTPFQLAVEPMCELSWEVFVMKVSEKVHLGCSFLYTFLAFGTYVAKRHHYIKDTQIRGGFCLDVVAMGGVIAEIVHVHEVPSDVPSLAQWFRLLHLAKLWRLSLTFHHVASSHSGFTLQVLFLFGALIMAAHVFACLMMTTAALEAHVGLQTWADSLFDVQPDQSEQSGFDFYVGSLYFAVATMTATGYGELVPVTIIERLFTIVFMLFASMFSAKIIADLNWITSMHQYWLANYQARVTQMQAALSSLGVPKVLCHRILAYQDYIENAKKEWRVRGCLTELSGPLQEELKLATYHSLVTRAPFLQAQPIDVLRCIVSALEDQVFLPCDVILRRGHAGAGIFFMRSGKAGVFLCPGMPSWSQSEIYSLTTGCYFGETGWLTGRPQKAWVLARTYSVCSVLTKQVMNEISANHPGCFVLLVNSVKDSLKLTRSVTFHEIRDRLAAKFQDLAQFKTFACSGSKEDIEEMLQMIPGARFEDKDRISWSQFRKLMDKLHVSSFDQKMIWSELDTRGTGFIDYDSFLDLIGLPKKFLAQPSSTPLDAPIAISRDPSANVSRHPSVSQSGSRNGSKEGIKGSKERPGTNGSRSHAFEREARESSGNASDDFNSPRSDTPPQYSPPHLPSTPPLHLFNGVAVDKGVAEIGEVQQSKLLSQCRQQQQLDQLERQMQDVMEYVKAISEHLGCTVLP